MSSADLLFATQGWRRHMLPVLMAGLHSLLVLLLVVFIAGSSNRGEAANMWNWLWIIDFPASVCVWCAAWLLEDYVPKSMLVYSPGLYFGLFGAIQWYFIPVLIRKAVAMTRRSRC